MNVFYIFHMRFWQILDLLKEEPLNSTLRRMIYFNRKAIPTEYNLCSQGDSEIPERLSDYQLVDLTSTDLSNKQISSEIKNRNLKYKNYLRKGFFGIGLLRNNRIVADLWYADLKSTENTSLHKDVIWLDHHVDEKCAYLFDLYIIPSERPNAISATFMKAALASILGKGYEKALGYYWSDNKSAMWIHRIVGWRELSPIIMNRIVFINYKAKTK